MIFSENSSTFSFVVNPLSSEEQLGKGVWLILIGVNEIPPHIALVFEGKYYSLSIHKAECGTSLERFLGILERKRIPTLFIRLNENTTERNNSFNAIIQQVYEDLQPLGKEENTCLYPIKMLFAATIATEFARVNYVFELLSMAQEKGLLQECCSLYYSVTNSKIVTLQKYTMAQIKESIRLLSSKIAPINN